MMGEAIHEDSDNGDMFLKRFRKREIRNRGPEPQQRWRRRTRGDEQLPKLEGNYYGPVTSGQRCHATDLLLGDCKQHAPRGSDYCYYHEKLRVNLLEPSAALYPVWPLPKGGYVLTDRALVAA